MVMSLLLSSLLILFYSEGENMTREVVFSNETPSVLWDLGEVNPVLRITVTLKNASKYFLKLVYLSTYQLNLLVM